MKRILSVIFANLILLTIFYFIISLVINNVIPKQPSFFPDRKIHSVLADDDYEFLPQDHIRIKQTEEISSEFCGGSRLNINSEYSERPIVFLGCSYTFGHGIKLEESFPYLLSEYTHRSVLNYSMCGGDIIGSIDSINNFPEYLGKVKNADYVIYLYMYDHVNRYLFNYDLYYDYIFNPGPFEKFITKSKILRVLLSKIRFIKLNREFPKTDAAVFFLKSVLKNAINEIHKIMPEAKIIFVIYDEKILLNDINDNYQRNVIRYEKDIIHSNIWSEFAKEYGITVVYTKDILGKTIDKDYKLKADFVDWHPNAKVWQDFVPEFVNRYIH